MSKTDKAFAWITNFEEILLWQLKIWQERTNSLKGRDGRKWSSRIASIFLNKCDTKEVFRLFFNVDYITDFNWVL